MKKTDFMWSLLSFLSFFKSFTKKMRAYHTVKLWRNSIQIYINWKTKYQLIFLRELFNRRKILANIIQYCIILLEWCMVIWLYCYIVMMIVELFNRNYIKRSILGQNNNGEITCDLHSEKFLRPQRKILLIFIVN